MSIFQKPFQYQNDSGTPENMEEDAPAFLNQDGKPMVRWITECHVACVFLLDVSSSMLERNAIGKLNEGLRIFKEQTLLDSRHYNEHTQACIDVAIVSFGREVKVVQEFTPVSDMKVPELSAGGRTPMGAALNKAMDMVTEQKNRYNNVTGTPYFRPWIFCITDGGPNDDYREAAQRLRNMEANKGVLGYCVGTENYNREIMQSIFVPERMYELDNLDFPSLFKFVSNSLTTIQNSDAAGERKVQIEMAPTIHKAEVYF